MALEGGNAGERQPLEGRVVQRAVAPKETLPVAQEELVSRVLAAGMPMVELPGMGAPGTQVPGMGMPEVWRLVVAEQRAGRSLAAGILPGVRLREVERGLAR